MPRRKKEAVSTDAVAGSVKSEKKKKRVGVAVRVLKEKAKPAVAAVPVAVQAPVKAAPAPVPVAPVMPATPFEAVSPAPLASPTKQEPVQPAVQAQAVTAKPTRPYSEKEKSMIMWTAVIFIMIMVFGLWFMSIKLQLQSEVIEKPTDQFDFKKVSDDITNAMREANESLKQLASTTPTSTPETVVSATTTERDLTSTTTEEMATTTSLNEEAIQNTIKELELRLNRGTTEATSSVR
ncbi:hypothetical protein HGA34_01810 [Candidatus Falkowbacteria bacterium]|nr:hypothetical protein [Candidatus Falkowbacteria bacterium]